eukprot:COSAG05_NODE_1011_length_6206_cov_2.116751_9_plen_113_part_00
MQRIEMLKRFGDDLRSAATLAKAGNSRSSKAEALRRKNSKVNRQVERIQRMYLMPTASSSAESDEGAPGQVIQTLEHFLECLTSSSNRDMMTRNGLQRVTALELLRLHAFEL